MAKELKLDANGKPIRTKGQKVAKILVATLTPLVCATSLGLGGYYAYLKFKENEISLTCSEEETNLMTWEGNLKMHQRINIKIIQPVGESKYYGWKFNKIELFEIVKGQEVHSSFSFSYDSFWHISSDGCLYYLPGQYVEFTDNPESHTEVYLQTIPSKSGNFKIKLTLDSSLNKEVK